jgi:FixJ family two-component response regulator
LVLDVRLPEVSGIKVQEELSRTGVYVPIVFVTGHADVAMAVRAMKAGAVDFLTKPFRSQDLLDAVFAALERDTARRKMQQWRSILREHYESLSARQRQVIARVAAGKLNKQIAADLGLSEVTVKVHRAHAMRKLRARTVADLVRMIAHLTAAAPGGQISDRFATWRGFHRRVMACQTYQISSGSSSSLAASAYSLRKRCSPSFTTSPRIPSTGVAAMRDSIL